MGSVARPRGFRGIRRWIQLGRAAGTVRGLKPSLRA
jgi:hypothetical protein